jgi:hypothetical protein
VTAHHARVLCALATAALLAGCSSATGGSGSAEVPTGAGSSTTPDFPTALTTPPPTLTSPASVPSDTVPSDTSGPTIHPAPATPLRTATVHAPDGTTYVVKIWADVTDPTCFDHAYGGPIITFLTEHPCSGLERYLGTTTVNGRPVGFAESATGFPGTAKDPYYYATRFSQLEKADGTGSIDDLLRDGYRLPSGPTSVPSPDAFNVLGQDNGVTVWDVWYLDEPTPFNDKPLMKMTTDIFLQF